MLALVETAIWSRFMRSSMLDVVNQDYIRTARAKGLPEPRILLRHAFRNAALPMITVVGLQLPTLLGGALVTETVFTWPGMGRLFLDSISYHDYPVVMGILMFSATMVLIGSLLLFLLGIGLAIYAVASWGSAGFGRLAPAETMRLVIPSVTAMIIAVQTAYGAAFVSVLQIRRHAA